MPSTGDYFAAARDLMADGDPRKVTIDALCKRVGTTSGSFYHHFGSLDGFVDALAADWSDRAVRAMHDAIAGIANVPGTRRIVNERLLLQHHQTEAAFRAWARTNAAMRRAVERVDDARFDASRTMVAALNPELTPEEVEACAQISVLIIIGAQARDPDTAAKVSAAALASFAALIERR
jgi:AcrR family transcriptional regulator